MLQELVRAVPAAGTEGGAEPELQLGPPGDDTRGMLLDHAAVTASGPSVAVGNDLATLRLVCLVRAGDGYVVRAVGELAAPLPGRRQVDITFGDAADRGRASELDAAVRLIQRWCDDGTTVALVETGDRLALRAGDGTEAVLPRVA